MIGKNKKIDKKNQPKKLIKCPNCQIDIEETELSIHMQTHPSKVYDWLYIGSYFNATNKKELENLNIKYILNCGAECQNLFEQSEGNDIKYLKLPIKDVNDFQIKDYFEEAINYLKEIKENYDRDKTKGNVLVHCQLGKSRSSTIIIAYMIKELKMTTNVAYVYLKKKRRNIMPNLGFMRQLREFENMYIK